MPTEKELKKFYYSSKWLKARHIQLKKFPNCKACGKIANEVDHILPLRQRPDLALNPNNFTSYCTSCHSRKTFKKDKGTNPFW